MLENKVNTFYFWATRMKKVLKFIVLVAILAAIAFGVKTFFFDTRS